MTPSLTVEVIGTRKQVKVTGIFDTGFDGRVCLPIDVAVSLGLELRGTEVVELADGTIKNELVFRGWIRFLGRKGPAKILLTESEDALIGTRLMKNCRALIDFDTGRVKVSKRKHN